MKTIATKIVCLLIATGFLANCRTTRGLGRDIQHLGSKIESEAVEKSAY